MIRTCTLAILLALTVTGCGISNLHIGHLDHMPNVGWRHHAAGDVCSFECFDDDGNVLGACQGCYDLDKNPIPGCVPGHWDLAPEKEAIDAKINAKRTEDHCRLTAYGCMCTGLAYPWTEAQKKVYPACDPKVLPVVSAANVEVR